MPIGHLGPQNILVTRLTSLPTIDLALRMRISEQAGSWEYLISPRRSAGDRNVGIGFIDFQGIRFVRTRLDSYDEGETLST